MKTLLTIAGFDPTSGAGVTLDLAVFRKLGFHGAALITALTSQNTLEVVGLHPVPGDFLELQHRILSRDIEVSGVKLGMLGSGEILPTVRRILALHAGVPVVIDPVMRSTSGASLMKGGSLPAWLKTLRGRAALLTPNLDEAEAIAGVRIRSREDLEAGAVAVHQCCGIPVLLKGGHLPGRAVDCLYDGETTTLFSRSRVDREAHGTGCFLSAAVLGYLASGFPLAEACRLAGNRLARALRKSAGIGKGRNLLTV